MKQGEKLFEIKKMLESTLEKVPFLQKYDLSSEVITDIRSQPDLVLKLAVGGQQWTLVCEVKTVVQPRTTRIATLELRDYCLNLPSSENVYPILLSEYISDASAAICREENVGYMDLAGTCYLCFDHVYIEQQGERKRREAQRRDLRSLFGLKAARVLRIMLDYGRKAWKVAELAALTNVSLGQVSNVRKGLIDREVAQDTEEGLLLTQPNALLDDWRGVYEKRPVSRQVYYSLLKGEEIDKAVREAIAAASKKGGRILLASFSAARWLAPYAQSPVHYFYADEAGERLLRRHLQLESVSEGGNVVVEQPRDEHLFNEGLHLSSGLRVTSPVQTWLDLSITGDRGFEAAMHLRAMAIDKKWENSSGGFADSG